MEGSMRLSSWPPAIVRSILDQCLVSNKPVILLFTKTSARATAAAMAQAFRILTPRVKHADIFLVEVTMGQEHIHRRVVHSAEMARYDRPLKTRRRNLMKPKSSQTLSYPESTLQLQAVFLKLRSLNTIISNSVTFADLLASAKDNRMPGTSVLQQTKFFSLPADPPQSLELSLRLKEQECFSILKRCKNMEEFRQAHAQIWLRVPSQMGVAWTMPVQFFNKLMNRACACLQAQEEGKQIHGHAFKLGLESDLYVQNSLINMYGKCGEIEHSCAIFEQMDQKSVASWSAIIAAHASFGKWYECLMMFGNMSSEGCWKPEESTLVTVLSACTHLGALDLGKCTHGSLLRNISELNVIVQTSLMDMYVKCGCLEKGLSLFRKMGNRSQMSYTVMISGLAMHGHGEEALRIYSEMLKDGLDPDDVVYVGVLSACSHAGLVDEGFRCFDRMKSEHGITPTVQHYGCMVDLMGKAGMINEALEFIKSMPIKPNDVVWRSLLSACRVHCNLEIGEISAKHLFQSKSQNPGDYVILSNMYARAQRWQEVAKIRVEMARKGLHQVPGFSLVEVGRRIHKFVSQDTSHPQCVSVYEMIHQMEWQLKFEGYSPDTSQVLLDVDEEEKRQRLKGHSQKLAIAFALIHTSQGSPIRIARNLRMCNDCHTYTKLISLIYEREITVRDRNRFHHFKDGTCSCRDYR
ncbi:Pentatricopeptide repeat - like 10 [Theobroma cacao]|nr:Pentatricopeptide repeat - like 10 [Theobroma cacao]